MSVAPISSSCGSSQAANSYSDAQRQRNVRILRKPDAITEQIWNSEWQSVQFGFFKNVTPGVTSRIVRHTGVKVTFRGTMREVVFIMDWAEDPNRAGKGFLFIQFLDDEQNAEHLQWNDMLPGGLSFRLTSAAKYELTSLFERIGTTFDDFSYNVASSDCNCTAFNCRGFCNWVMMELRQFREAGIGNIDEAQENVDRVITDDKLIVSSGITSGAGSLSLACILFGPTPLLASGAVVVSGAVVKRIVSKKSE